MIRLDCLFTRHSIASSCWFGAESSTDRNQTLCFVFFVFFPVLEGLSSHMRVAGLAGQAPSPQVDSWTGLGLVLTVTTGGPVVVDLRPPGVCGDDPCGGSPLLQGIRSFDTLLDLFSRPPQGSIWLYQTLPWKTGGNTDQYHVASLYMKHSIPSCFIVHYNWSSQQLIIVQFINRVQVIYQIKLPNICRFTILQCEDLHLI